MHAHEVVSVHDRVDETVEDNGKVNVAVVVDARVEPVEQEDAEVVVHVQERELPRAKRVLERYTDGPEHISQPHTHTHTRRLAERASIGGT